MTDDLTRLRLLNSAPPPPWPGLSSRGSPAFIGKVTSTGPALAVGKFAALTPQIATGAEVAGTAAILTAQSGAPSVLVYQLGPAPFSTGDFIPCRFVDYRWVGERMTTGGGGGGGGGTTTGLPSCYCPSIPETLTMVSRDPNCNYKMFQSCTIQYQATPAVFAPLNLGANAFISTTSFLDPLTGSLFFYLLTCQYNQFSLTRLYPTSPYGSPYRDGVLYTWLVGGYGNTCSPFHLDNGSAYPGSDVTCFVTIDPA